jgi:hypothetical protein
MPGTGLSKEARGRFGSVAYRLAVVATYSGLVQFRQEIEGMNVARINLDFATNSDKRGSVTQGGSK